MARPEHSKCPDQKLCLKYGFWFLLFREHTCSYINKSGITYWFEYLHKIFSMYNKPVYLSSNDQTSREIMEASDFLQHSERLEGQLSGRGDN